MKTPTPFELSQEWDRLTFAERGMETLRNIEKRKQSEAAKKKQRDNNSH